MRVWESFGIENENKTSFVSPISKVMLSLFINILKDNTKIV